MGIWHWIMREGSVRREVVVELLAHALWLLVPAIISFLLLQLRVLRDIAKEIAKVNIPEGIPLPSWAVYVFVYSFIFILTLVIGRQIIDAIPTWEIGRRVLYWLVLQYYGLGYVSVNHHFLINGSGGGTLLDKITVEVKTRGWDSLDRGQTADQPFLDDVYRMQPYTDTSGIEVRAENVKLSNDRKTLTWRLRLTQELPAKSPVSITSPIPLPPNFFKMTLEELESGREWCSWTVLVPTKHLRLQVTFPPEFNPINPDFDVIVALHRIIHSREMERLTSGRDRYLRKDRHKTGDRAHCYYLQLDIPFPLQGLKYILYWQPPR